VPRNPAVRPIPTTGFRGEGDKNEREYKQIVPLLIRKKDKKAVMPIA
jgi:hypothetical protein